MGVSTITNLSNSLRRTYSNRYFKAFQNDFTPILNELDECPNSPTLGEGWYFPFHFSSPQNWGINSEGGSMGTVNQRTEVQGKVNAVEFLGWMQITDLLKNVAKASASWNGGELNRQMKETTSDITKGMQRMFVISAEDGRLGVIQDSIAAATTFVAKLDEGVNCLMDNDLIDVYTGAGALEIDGIEISKIARSTRTVTLASAQTATADSGIYKKDAYAVSPQPNGLRGLVDDSTNQASVHGQARATYEKLKSVVEDPGVPTALTEQHMREVCDEIYLRGGSVDRIFCNVGVMNAFFDINTGNRRYNMVGGNTAKMVLGYKEGDALFSYDKGSVTIKKDPNIQARTMYFLSLKESFQKHTVKKLGWLDEGGSILRLTPNGSDGFNTSWTALISAQTNISCINPYWNGVRRNIKDETLAGD